MINNALTNIIDFFEVNKVVVPVIQRDYAHGRKREEENAIRDNLLDDIFDVLTARKNEWVLNYIYGVPKSNDKYKDHIVLIDGQQRVTTLYLLLLFLSINAEKENKYSGHLIYETRITSTDFCGFLSKVDNLSSLKCGKEYVSQRLSKNKSFYRKWLNDPTVNSMLNMLDAINERADKELNDPQNELDKQAFFEKCYNNIKNIKFSFISLDGFKREEELYSVMNGRGKQLTEFEQIKPILLSKVSDQDVFSGEINDIWIPGFWSYTDKKYINDQSISKMDYVKENHDRYLFNYYSFLLRMLKKDVQKRKTIAKITDELSEEDINFIRFAMCNSKTLLFDHNFGDDICSSEFFPENHADRIVTDEKIDADLMFCCCYDDITRLQMMLLWAYIRFKYNSHKNMINNHSLKEYYMLARDIYASAWDSNTPTSLDKSPNPSEFDGAVERFEKILDNNQEERNSAQYLSFYNYSSAAYKVLNNPLTRGRSTNLISIIRLDSEEMINKFCLNLSEIYKKIGAESFKCLSSIEHSFFINTNNDNHRPYMPYSEKMLKSLFSLDSWKDDSYESFLLDLCNKSFSNVDFNESEWQYYVLKYENDFFKGNPYTAFLAKDSTPDFNMRAIYGERATEGQVVSPFLLAAYRKKYGADSKVKTVIYYAKEFDFGITVGSTKDEKPDGTYVIKFKNIEKNIDISETWDKESRTDLVEFIEQIMPVDN